MTDRPVYAASDDESFEVDPNASILDYLNPDIFKNETLMDEIRKRLHNNELVVVYDAFLPEFADYVWEDLSSDEIEWKHHEEFNEDGFIYR